MEVYRASRSFRREPGIVYIYCLWANGADAPFYIGKAANPYWRLYGHISAAKRRAWYSSRLINSLLISGTRIDLDIIARCTDANWQETERSLIAEYKTRYALANTAEGGRGGITRTGFHQSAEHRRKIGMAHKGKHISEVQKKALSDFAKTRIFGRNSRARAVLQFDRSGVLVKEWDCALRAEVECGFSATKISACCKGRSDSHGQFVWRYKL